MSKNELCHFGVKGMKWGVRKDARPIKDARRDYKEAKREYERAKKADPVRKNIRRGAAVAAGILAIYGTHKMHELMTSPNTEWTVNDKKYMGREGYDAAKSLVKQMITRKH